MFTTLQLNQFKNKTSSHFTYINIMFIYLPFINISDIEIPERPRLRMFEKVPQYPSNLKPPKMQKRLRYMRGPELLHNKLQLKQYGVVVSYFDKSFTLKL